MFQIQQQNGQNRELIDNGTFDTVSDAIDALGELNQSLGWTGIRVIETDDRGMVRVIETIDNAR